MDISISPLELAGAAAAAIDIKKDAATYATSAKKHMTLAELPRGREARVIAVNGTGSVTRRLMEMGVIPGVGVRVVKVAPFGDPIEIRVRGYSLAMRKSEADSIEVDG